jgi:L-threonylcarbamoyladenylate synthase
VRTPGTLESHYAPRDGVFLEPTDRAMARAGALAQAGQKVAVLSTSRAGLPEHVDAFELPADPAGFARELYAALRRIDALGYEVIVAAPPEGAGLARAVRDRLRRAAAPRG